MPTRNDGRTPIRADMRAYLDELRSQDIKFRELDVVAARAMYAAGSAARSSLTADLLSQVVFDSVTVGQTNVLLVSPVSRDGSLSRTTQRGIPILLAHGGGFIVGEPNTHREMAALFASACGQTVASVDYRLAPENRYPAAVADCVRVADWLVESSGLASTGSIGVAGDSAGGSIVTDTVYALASRPNMVRAAMLAYPALDPTLQTASAHALGNDYGLTTADMRYCWDQYLGRSRGARNNLTEVAAAMPPTVVLTAEWDPLHDEAIDFIANMRNAGVEVDHIEGHGLIHGMFDYQHAVPSAAAATGQAIGAFASHLTHLSDARPSLPGATD